MNQIEPALTPEEWASDYHPTPTHVARIALANAALPADDPRKITREKVERLHEGARAMMNTHYERCTGGCTCERESDALDAFADALASYLPPEGT